MGKLNTQYACVYHARKKKKGSTMRKTFRDRSAHVLISIDNVGNGISQLIMALYPNRLTRISK